jgi:hypothetical protein
MSTGSIKKEDLFNVIKYGHAWHSEKIKEELDKLIVMNPNGLHHSIRYDSEDKYYFIYENDCYLFAFDGKIEVRCDRENVFSSDKTFTYEIKEAKDIFNAYEHFISVTMEGEDEDEDEGD